MKFEQNPKRCYMCSKAFSQAIKPIPVIGGKCTPGYIAQLAMINYLGGINKNDEKTRETPPGADDGRLERKSKR